MQALGLNLVDLSRYEVRHFLAVGKLLSASLAVRTVY